MNRRKYIESSFLATGSLAVAASSFGKLVAKEGETSHAQVHTEETGLSPGATPTFEAQTFNVPSGQRQLFMDDFGIAKIENLTRTMHRPEKKGAVIRPNVDRGETVLQTRCAPVWDPEAGVYKIWMITSASHSGTTYAESPDGLHWRKPALRQREVNGSLENNYVTLDARLEWPANAMENVVYDPDDPDTTRRFKGFAHCYDREPIVSPDGIHWRKLDVPPIPSSDESNLSYDSQTRTFLATVKHGGPFGRSVFLSTSTDFSNWTKPELLFHADELDQMLGRGNIARRFANPVLQRPALDIPATYNVDIYNMGLFRYEGLYIGLPSVFHKTGQVPGDWSGFAAWNLPPDQLAAFRQSGDWSGFHHVQLICSRELRNWQRLGDRQPFIDLSPLDAGAYDLSCIIGPSYPIIRDEKLWFYYTGLKQYGGPNPFGEMDQANGAICLAVLRRDGFISMDAGERKGTLITKPFILTGTNLWVNVDAPKGTLSVEVLDEAGNEASLSTEITGDLSKGKILWKTGTLAGLQGKRISLKFTLCNGSVYSYWFE